MKKGDKLHVDNFFSTPQYCVVNLCKKLVFSLLKIGGKLVNKIQKVYPQSY